PIGENSRLELRYTLSQDKLKNVSPDSSAILHTEEAIGSQITSSVGYTYSLDTRKTGLNPKGGYLLRFGQDFAGLGGDLRFVNTSGLALAETRVLNEDVTLRAVFEGGAISMINGDSRVTERYFGNGKIRGFEGNGLGPRDLNSGNQDALGGNFYAVARFEADFPLGFPEEYGLKGGLFLDAGSVWSLDNTQGGPVGGPLAEVDDGLNLRSSIGVSVFWTTPVGPLRLNLSRALKKEPYDKERNLDLTISSEF
ncbi:MAG: BamA/TamA family outer membrane protein, partial [Paracoccaceae bacterium]|nr:BamA/TamA family outer membrane protein [Paracoccaceae bacterium]